MAEHKAQTGIADLARQTQALFNPNGTAVPGIGPLLKIQEDLSEEAETFARHWLERRREAADTAVEALREMSSTGRTDPAAAMRAITDWQRGSLKRLNADMREWMALCTQATHLAATAQDAAAPADADRGKPAKPGRRAAASASGSEPTTPV